MKLKAKKIIEEYLQKKLPRALTGKSISRRWNWNHRKEMTPDSYGDGNE